MNGTLAPWGARRAQALKRRERRDYDFVAPFYDADTTPLTDVFGRESVERLGLRRGEHVVEVCCGSGNMFPEILPRIGADGSLTGVDQSDGMLAIARRRIEQARWSNIHLVQSDAETLDTVPRQSADAVISVFGFMYLPNPLRALRAVHEVLRPGGRAVVTVWGIPALVPGLTLPMEAGARVLAPIPFNWLLATAPGRWALFKYLLKQKLGGGKSPMGLGPDGLLDSLFRRAGFTNIARSTRSSAFVYDTVDDYWRVLMGTPARALVGQYPERKVALTKDVVAQLLDRRHRREDGRLSIPMTAVTVTGTA